MSSQAGNPAALVEHDPEWARCAREHLVAVEAAMHELPGIEDAWFDHIGSTSVSGLAAKPFFDLQVRILPLPGRDELELLIRPLGYTAALGARADSPGVLRDRPRGDERVSAEVWDKHLYVHHEHSVVLHVRRTDSPWGRHTVWFRDWLRAHPVERRRYELAKRRLAAANVGKSDYDDYTRAKTAFFDEVQDSFTRWAKETGHRT